MVRSVNLLFKGPNDVIQSSFIVFKMKVHGLFFWHYYFSPVSLTAEAMNSPPFASMNSSFCDISSRLVSYNKMAAIRQRCLYKAVLFTLFFSTHTKLK